MKKCALFMALVLAGEAMAYDVVYPVQTATVVPSQISGLPAANTFGAFSLPDFALLQQPADTSGSVGLPGTLERPGLLGPPIAVVPTTQTTAPAPATGLDPVGSPMTGLPGQLGMPSGWAVSSGLGTGDLLGPVGLGSSNISIPQEPVTSAESITGLGLITVPGHTEVYDQFAASDPGAGEIPGPLGLGSPNGSTP